MNLQVWRSATPGTWACLLRGSAFFAAPVRKIFPNKPHLSPILPTVFPFPLPESDTQKHSGVRGDAHQCFVTDFRQILDSREVTSEVPTVGKASCPRAPLQGLCKGWSSSTSLCPPAGRGTGPGSGVAPVHKSPLPSSCWQQRGFSQEEIVLQVLFC